MSKKYEVAILLEPYLIPDVIGEFDNKKEALDFYNKKVEKSPKTNYAWREVNV